jgi:hypothetical protein
LQGNVFDSARTLVLKTHYSPSIANSGRLNYQ